MFLIWANKDKTITYLEDWDTEELRPLFPYLCLQGRSSPSQHCCGSGRCRVLCWAPDPPGVGSYPWFAPNTSPAAHWVSPAVPLSGPSARWAQTHSSPHSPAAPPSTHTHPRAADRHRERERMIKGKKRDRTMMCTVLKWQHLCWITHTKGSYIKTVSYCTAFKMLKMCIQKPYNETCRTYIPEGALWKRVLVITWM